MSLSSESSSSSEQDRQLEADKYRFSGYNLPMVKLADGFEYYIVDVHPYFLNQPQVFQKPAFAVGFDTVGGNVGPIYSPRSLKATSDAGKPNKASAENPVLPI